MTTHVTGRLYTPEMLSLAVTLGETPPRPDLPLHGYARSSTCGGTLAIDLSLSDGRVADLGMLVQACAIGQASAAVFAKWAAGRSSSEVTMAGRAVQSWLDGDAPVPVSPDLAVIHSARDFPGRHGAVVLPWRAFADALCKAGG